jgi:hypothetical protein
MRDTVVGPIDIFDEYIQVHLKLCLDMERDISSTNLLERRGGKKPKTPSKEIK